MSPDGVGDKRAAHQLEVAGSAGLVSCAARRASGGGALLCGTQPGMLQAALIIQL